MAKSSAILQFSSPPPNKAPAHSQFVSQQPQQPPHVTGTTSRPDTDLDFSFARHFETLRYSHCAICLCPRPTGINLGMDCTYYPPTDLSTHHILDVDDGRKSMIHSQLHTFHLCTAYLTHGVPREYETGFWAYACPYFRGFVPCCFICGVIGSVRHRSGDVLMYPVQPCEIPIEGLSVGIRCNCLGNHRRLRKRWVTPEHIETLISQPVHTQRIHMLPVHSQIEEEL